MGERVMLPHDRGHLLWTSEEGASRMLTSSMDRWTTAIVGDDGVDEPVMGFGEKVTAQVTSRADGTVAGAAAVDYMLQVWAPSLSTSWRAGDGRRVSQGDVIVEINGDSESILRMERSILNLLGQLSGIATNAAHWATIAPRQVAATRKTVWGMLDKWAVHLGGGLTHRLNKDDATMIKENDLAVAGESGMQAIVQLLSTMDVANCGAFLELEVTNEKDAIVAASTWKQRHPAGAAQTPHGHRAGAGDARRGFRRFPRRRRPRRRARGFRTAAAGVGRSRYDRYDRRGRSRRST